MLLLWNLLESGSALKSFLDETANMTADERAKHLEENKVNDT